MKTLRYFSFFFLFMSCSCNDSSSDPAVVAPIVTPPLSEAELLDQVQKDALKYFIDYAHPNSKLARDQSRDNTKNIAY